MKKNFTKVDLIRFLYKETKHEESEKINEKIFFEKEFAKQFLLLKKEIDGLNSLNNSSPSNTIIDSILNYSKRSRKSEIVLL